MRTLIQLFSSIAAIIIAAIFYKRANEVREDIITIANYFSYKQQLKNRK